MSLPTNRKALDPSLLDSLMRESPEQRNEFLKSLYADPLTVLPTTSTPPKSTESFSSYTDEYVRNEYMSREQYEYRRRMDYEKLVMLQQMYAPGPDVMFQLDSELRKRATGIMENAEISALSGGSTPPAPSRSFTDRSNLSGASLMTSFLSRTSAKNSRSSPSSSKSGLPKLLSSPSKAIATKSSTRS